MGTPSLPTWIREPIIALTWVAAAANVVVYTVKSARKTYRSMEFGSSGWVQGNDSLGQDANPFLFLNPPDLGSPNYQNKVAPGTYAWADPKHTHVTRHNPDGTWTVQPGAPTPAQRKAADKYTGRNKG